MIDSDPENETHNVEECSFASTKSGLKTTFHKNWRNYRYVRCN